MDSEDFDDDETLGSLSSEATGRIRERLRAESGEASGKIRERLRAEAKEKK